MFADIRALYNDLIYLLHNNDVVPPIVLRKHSNKVCLLKYPIHVIITLIEMFTMKLGRYSSKSVLMDMHFTTIIPSIALFKVS